MPTGSKYATGDRAWGLCQICGLRFLLRDLVFDGYYPNLRVCVPCYDPRQPQEFLVDVTDPTALWKPSPEWGPENQALSGEVFANDAQLSWTECILRGQPRVNTYLLYRSVSNDGVNFTASVLIATLPVLYYTDLAALNENGNPPYNNQGIEAETLAFLDAVPGNPKFARYQVFAKLDGGRMVNSNLVTLPIQAVGNVDSISSGADFSFASIAAFLPPVGNSIESIQSGADFISAALTPADPFFADVILLLHFDGTNGQPTTTDSSSYANTMSMINSTKLSTAQVLYGTASLPMGVGGATHGGTQTPTGGPGGLFDMGTGDFTYELSFYWPGVSGFPQYLLGDGNGSTIGQLEITLFGNSSFGVECILDGAQSVNTPNVTSPGWHSLAFVRIGNVLTAYLDGVSGTPSAPISHVPNAPFTTIAVGYAGTAANNLDSGFIDEVRITKGVGRYTSNYTPSGPFPNG